jgi:hypothetical protein
MPRGTIAIDENLVGEQLPYPLIMEGHQPLKEDDIRRASISRLGESRILRERIPRNLHRRISLNQGKEGLIGEVKIDGIGMVEIVFSYIDHRGIHAYVGR